MDLLGKEEHMLTTDDNPWDPFIHFKEWQAWDVSHGYHTLPYLARVAKVSNELSDADRSVAIESAIDEIVELNILGVYKKVSRPTPA